MLRLFCSITCIVNLRSHPVCVCACVCVSVSVHSTCVSGGSLNWEAVSRGLRFTSLVTTSCIIQLSKDARVWCIHPTLIALLSASPYESCLFCRGAVLLQGVCWWWLCVYCSCCHKDTACSHSEELGWGPFTTLLHLIICQPMSTTFIPYTCAACAYTTLTNTHTRINTCTLYTPLSYVSMCM